MPMWKPRTSRLPQARSGGGAGTSPAAAVRRRPRRASGRARAHRCSSGRRPRRSRCPRRRAAPKRSTWATTRPPRATPSSRSDRLAERMEQRLRCTRPCRAVPERDLPRRLRPARAARESRRSGRGLGAEHGVRAELDRDGRSVESRSVKQRTPSADVSSCTPPESVSTKPASACRPRKSRYPSGRLDATPAPRAARLEPELARGAAACAGAPGRRSERVARARRAPSTVAVEESRGRRRAPAGAASRARSSPGSTPSSSHGFAAARARRGARRRESIIVLPTRCTSSRSIPSRARLSSALSEWASSSAAQVVGEQAVVLLRHRRVEAAQAGLEVRDRDVELDRGERAGERRVDVARDDDAGRAPLEQHLLDADERPRRLLAVRAGADAEEDVRLGQAELGRGRRPTCRRRSAGRCGRAMTSAPGSRWSARCTGATFMKFGRAPTTKQTLPGAAGIAGAYRVPGLDSLRARSQSAVLAVAGALLWTHVLYPLGAAALARVRTRVGAQGGHRAGGDGDRRRLQRGAGDRAAAREPARARLSGRQARARRHLRRLDRPDARAGRALRRPRAPDRQPARRQGGGAEPGRARDARRDRRVLRRERDLGAGCAAPPRRELRRRRRRLRLRAARARGRRRIATARASTGATRWCSARRSRGSARSPAATARSTRCVAPTTSRSTRSGATTSRSRT